VENVENIDPKTVHDLLHSMQCLLVDLRGEDRAAGLIEGAVHEPAIDNVPFPTKVPKLVQQWADQSLVIFTCQYSAHRAPQCANWYRQKASPRQRVAILSGGFRGWEAMGLPVQSLASGERAHAADEAAKQLGTRFAGGCVTHVPGGGFAPTP
jgi:rhodanese-related sulfurtransferase